MELRSGKIYENFHKRYRKTRRSFKTKLPLEIHFMIINEMLHNPNLLQWDFLSHTRVCKTWAWEIERKISLHASVKTRMIHLAARHDDIEALDAMISDHGIDLNSIDESGWIIAKRECKEVTENFPSENETGWTVLHTAAFHGSIAMFEHLIDNHGVLDDKNEDYISKLCTLGSCNDHTTISDMVVARYGPIN